MIFYFSKTLLQFTGDRNPRAAKQGVPFNAKEKRSTPAAPDLPVVGLESHFQVLGQCSSSHGILILSPQHRLPLPAFHLRFRRTGRRPSRQQEDDERKNERLDEKNQCSKGF